MNNSDRQDRLKNLSPAKRALLLAKLQQAAPTAPASIGIARHGSREIAPLSSAQQRIWFLDRLHPGASIYTFTAGFTIAGPLDVPLLGRSFNHVIRRHEILRTSFPVVDGQPVQRIAPEATLHLQQILLDQLGENDRAQAIEHEITAATSMSFDVRQGPLLRATLLHLAAERYILLLSIHYLLIDTWSIGILIAELIAHYEAHTGEQPRPEGARLPELPIQFADFAVWEQQWLASPEHDRQMAYWKQQLRPEGASPPRLVLPTDRPRPMTQTINGDTYPLHVDTELTGAAQALGRQENATLFMVLLAAFATVLRYRSGQTSLVVGTDIANRNRAETANLIGFLVNQLALRLDLGGDPSFRALLRHVREITLAGYTHQDLPFQRLVEELVPQRDPQFSPLVQVKLVLQNVALPALKVERLTVEPMTLTTHTAQFDLILNLFETQQGLTGGIEYNTDLFDRPTIAGIAEQFAMILRAVISTPETRLSECLALLDETSSGDTFWHSLDLRQVWAIKLPFELSAPTQAFTPAVVRAALDRSTGEGIAKAAQAYGSTPAAWLLACWHTLLWRLSEITPIVSGVAVREHQPAGEQSSAEHLTPYLPIESRPEPGTSLATLARQIAAMLHTAAKQREFFSWATIAEAVPEAASAGFFPIEFAYQAVPLPDEAADVGPAGHDQFKLRLVCAEHDGLIEAALCYDRGVFLSEAIATLAEQFKTLVGSALGQAEAAIDTLTIISAAERTRLLEAFNTTDTVLPADTLLHRLIETQVARTPGHCAVGFAEQRLSYAALNAQANQLAHVLQSYGVGPETRVALCLPRSLDLIVAVLAVLKAGGGYVPLDPDYPEERLRFMLADAQVAVLVTHARLLGPEAAWLPEHHCPTICLDQERLRIAEASAETPPCAATPDNLAYMIYTSGSTGRPKGTLVTHRSAAHSTLARLHYYHPPIGNFLLLSSLAFDSSVAGIFGTLSQGGTLSLPGEHVQNDLPQLARTIAGLRITHWLTTPSLYSYLLEQPDVQQLESLQAVIVAGEACPPELVTRHHARMPQVALYNEYGPTEATVWSTVYATRPDEPTALIPIGRPIANTRIYLLDRLMQPMPIGVAGELYIGGVGITRGYHSRPDLTAERFIPDPFSTGPGARLYRTGDLARYRADSNIEFLGRIDQQVKLRGYRIELGEIQAVLAQHPAVREVVVVARQDTDNTRLVAYVVENVSPLGKQANKEQTNSDTFTDSCSPLPDGTPRLCSPQELRTFLADRLPEYMVPSTVVILDALPLTPNGKIDYRALPEPGATDPAESFVSPRTATEDLLVELWCGLLSREQLSVHDNFFELGGHSIMATQLITRLQAIFQVELPLLSIFEAPTIAQLAPRLDAAVRESQGLEAPPIMPVPRDGRPLPLSTAQQRLWFREQLMPGSLAFNNPAAIRLSGPLDVMALEQTFSAIVARHEIMRTRFVVVDDKPVQQIEPAEPIQLPVLDLTDWQEHEAARDPALDWGPLRLAQQGQEGAAGRIVLQLVRQPFDLSRETPMRLTLLRLAHHDHILVIVMHHIASDAWTLGVILQEIKVLYATFQAGGPRSADTTLPTLPIQYADYAAWERAWLDSAALATHLNYWKQQLTGAPRLALPTDRPRPAVQGSHGAFTYLDIAPDLSRAFREWSRKQGATLFMSLLAIFETLLYAATGQDDIVIGTDVANRNHAETEVLVGFFVNQIALRLNLTDNPSFHEVLERVRATTLAAYAHQDVPFDMVVETVQPQRNLSYAPIFQVLFGFDNTPIPDFAIAELTLSDLKANTASAIHDLSLIWVTTPEGLRGQWRYNTDLFDHATIDRLSNHFVAVMRAIVEQPEVRLNDLAAQIAASERQQRQIEQQQRKATRRDQLRGAQRQAVRVNTTEKDVL